MCCPARQRERSASAAVVDAREPAYCHLASGGSAVAVARGRADYHSRRRGRSSCGRTRVSKRILTRANMGAAAVDVRKRVCLTSFAPLRAQRLHERRSLLFCLSRPHVFSDCGCVRACL